MHDVRKRPLRRARTLLSALLLVLATTGTAAAAAPIRTSPANRVPACVTPERLSNFLLSRNPALDPRLRHIAQWYKRHGEAWRVRWDYAFFQMVLETNFLTFRRPDGRMGDAHPRQNNFAGLGTTGGGTPGDSYPDMPTGVLAQIQHLVVYSGERIPEPVGPRTRLKQDDILAAMARVLSQRPATFHDLAGRWAADRSYGRSIENIAGQFGERYCRGQPERFEVAAAPAPGSAAMSPQPRPPQPVASGWPAPSPAPDPRQQFAAMTPPPMEAPRNPLPAQMFAPEPPSAAPVASCRVQAASYGGRKTLLIRTVAGGVEQLTALSVLDGFERSMAESFIRTHAPGGQPIAEFGSPDAALARAFELCPAARQ
jgi:hypothetical protein